MSTGLYEANLWFYDDTHKIENPGEVTGEEFGELRGHTLVVYKVLYGLRSSGLRWHEKLGGHLHEMGFCPSKAEPDIWMRERDGLWEYIGVYVDDLAIVSKNP